METAMASSELVKVEGLSKTFRLKHPLVDSLLGRPRKVLKAVDDVSFSIRKGETLGLVGESGCGKSTLAKTIMRLYDPDRGRILFEGRDLAVLKGEGLRRERARYQMIFQDPYSSLNPRMSVRDTLTEVMAVHRVCPRKEMDRRIAELMLRVGMREEMADRFPGEFSGGQRQRIGIARALALNPAFIVADEPVSALDVSIQAQIINLLADIQQSLDLTLMFISHDLRVVRHVAHRVAVMYLGKVVELGETEALFERPAHPYTDVLVKAAPVLDPRDRTREYAIEGEPPSPINIPAGCRFHPRCRCAQPVCRETEPALAEVAPGRQVACHFPLNL